MKKIIALLLAAGLILLGIYYFNTSRRHTVEVVETQVDTTQPDAIAEVAVVEQEAAAQ